MNGALPSLFYFVLLDPLSFHGPCYCCVHAADGWWFYVFRF